jgi:DNA polymerase-3 subunit delta
MTVEELENELKKGVLIPLYLLYGDEKYLLEMCIKKIKNLFGEKVKGINYIMLDETNIGSIVSNIEVPAFGFDKKLIIIKDSGLFKKPKRNGAKVNSELVDTLNKYLIENMEEVNKSNIIVFLEDVEKNDLYKTIEKFGAVCESPKLNLQSIIKRLMAIVLAYKVKISVEVLQYFVETCGTNMQDLINEIRKLIEYAGENGEITKDMINNLSTKHIDAIIFDLTDNLGEKNIRNALKILNNLLYNKEPVQKILITLYNHFKKLYIAKLAQSSNRNLAEAMDLKPNQLFLQAKYKKQASCFTKENLARILKEFTDLDLKYKSGLIDINIGLEAILCEFCS